MVPLNLNRSFLSRLALHSSLVKMASLFKVSYIVGSYAAFFSGINVAMPLVGAFGGLALSCAVFGVNFLITGLLSAYPLHFLAYHIPGLFASAYWAHDHWSIRLAVPLVCMALFVAHPVGMLAAPYALYWLIPVALYFRSSTVITQAVGSTMTAHAVGSVIWLYTVPMSVAAWYTLIPVVAIERLLFATGMVVAHKAITWVMIVMQTKQTAPALYSLEK